MSDHTWIVRTRDGAAISVQAASAEAALARRRAELGDAMERRFLVRGRRADIWRDNEPVAAEHDALCVGCELERRAAIRAIHGE